MLYYKMRDLQLFGRLGNKTNDIKHFKHLLPLDVINVVEPFGGTFAVIKNIYNSTNYIKYVNDNDPGLFAIYNDPNGFAYYTLQMNELMKSFIYDKTTKNNLVDFDKFYEHIEELGYDQDPFYNEWKNHHQIRGKMLHYLKTLNNGSFTDQIILMKSIRFTNDDYKIVLDRHRQDPTAFIFIDPPYLFSHNDHYSAQSKETGIPDMTQIIIDLVELLKDPTTKAKIMIIINDMAILRWLFKDFIKMAYSRIYQLSKNKDRHLIITNY